MPSRPPKPCRHHGCKATTTASNGYCGEHQRTSKPKQKPVALTHDRQERHRFYQRAIWKRLRAERLSIEPMCRHCRGKGKLTEATVVDHITPFFMPDDALATDQNNLQSLCVSCHNAKTNTIYGVMR